MRRPAGRLVTGSREAFGQHRPPATTSGTCERTNARSNGHRSCAPSQRQAKAGPEAINPAVERREACVRRHRRARAQAHPAPAGLRHWPANGCRCTRCACRRSAPSGGQWELCKPRRALCLAGRMMRGLAHQGRAQAWSGSAYAAAAVYRFRARRMAAPRNSAARMPMRATLRPPLPEPQSMPNWPLPRYPKHPTPIPIRPQDGTFPFTLYPWCNSAGAAIRLRISPELEEICPVQP